MACTENGNILHLFVTYLVCDFHVDMPYMILTRRRHDVMKSSDELNAGISGGCHHYLNIKHQLQDDHACK